jgi:hypothetical protein
LYVGRVFGRRFSSRRRYTWTSVEARSTSFLLFLIAAALRRASNATAAAATTGIWDGDLGRVDGLNGGGFERHRYGWRRRAGETRAVLGGGVFDGLDR